jgi:hypothetical protein
VRWLNQNVLTPERRNLTRETAGGRSQYYDAESEQRLRKATPLGQKGLEEWAEFFSGEDDEISPEDVTPQGLAEIAERKSWLRSTRWS